MRRKTRYTPAPDVPAKELLRLTAIVEVLAGLKTVSEAARGLKLSRNHFQTLLHRGIEGLVASIRTRPAGRPAPPKAVAALAAEVTRLKRENARLQARVGSTDRLLEVASGLLHGRIRPRRSRRVAKAGTRDDGDGDPDPEVRQQLAEIDAMRGLGLSAALAAAVAGVHPATVRRWRVRRGRRQQTAPRPSTAVSPAAVARVEHIVRALKGLVGAEALRRSVAGVSRRQAARVKAQVLTQLERERKARLTRVTVSVPGVIRGMDGVHFHGRRRPYWALIAADGAVPYRTSVTAGPRYDAGLVAKAVATDIERNGAPFVYRLDRAAAHEAPAARAVLEAHQVLTLHGPPCCPRYYGQLERQNREHRAWAGTLRTLPEEAIEPCLREMAWSVNALWRRRTLAWRTAAEAWRQRPRLDVDRQALREEVTERAARLRAHELHGKPGDLAERLAIEQVLQQRGYLRMNAGGWC